MNKQDKINAILLSHGKPPLSQKRYEALSNYQKDKLVKTNIEGYFYYPTGNCMVSTYLCDNYTNTEIKINGNVYYFRRLGKDHTHITHTAETNPDNVKSAVVSKTTIKIQSHPQESQSQQQSQLQQPAPQIQKQIYKPKSTQEEKHASLIEYFTRKKAESLKKNNNFTLVNSDVLSRTLIKTNVPGYFYYPKEDCMVCSDDLEHFVMKQKGRDNNCRMDIVAEHEWLKSYLNSL